MQKILIIDTSTEACSVALEVEGRLYEDYQVAPRQHGELVLPMVDSVLQQANLKLAELDCIGYGQGPGAFTGLRICVSIVQGLAFGAGIPVVGCSSLQAMAQLAYDSHRQKDVLPAIDARMGEVYWAQYQAQDGLMVLLGDETVIQPEDVTINTIIKSSYYATGSGWETYQSELKGALAHEIKLEAATSFPKASAMLPWVKAQLALGNAQPAELAQPVYLRNNVAKKKAEQGKP
ncbi:tRNA (adenosine(37)-N6)-threonylcarbamoyltransferase complex dimerization subunit type 1 TsaB [Kangiella sp. HZ709]|uniref:tRNA (adenosine(37)-N6)-threonylcarbamoyltransferase complex dimerization subunit type 1 TsaB n=1 Tax=Kangiella sp. HZ709 TaxID=2666328 RepID=UPI0012AF783C|nr:tRNA (adenosine(37)-N6)-threonylcarbamoyltransferase complex dimerization subunit type 1 TsaB [Kangiella sp. HZ709]MRX27048.1 tRNA (adenosine(37)-N6)-threonylcarbamoyltransferase complex dimerization subunit type 1 TsaB [Kangiella sp. HZ709]